MRVTRIIVLACTAMLSACQPIVSAPSVPPRPAPAAERSPSQPPAPPVAPPASPSALPTAAPAATVTPAPTDPPTAPLTPAPTSPSTFGPTGPTEVGRVVRVVDGDTIRVLIDGVERPLRYIGVDTPETVHPSQPVEWMGREASAANRRLVDGRTVVLEKDISETDQFGRLLRYVWLDHGGAWLLVNLELIQLGFALVSTYPPDVKYTELFLDAQREAREAERGLWGTPPEPPDDEPPPGGGSGPGEGCDPAYPGVCIPPSPPDLDCGDISYRRFEVLPPDPHRFDGNHDGIGCESG